MNLRNALPILCLVACVMSSVRAEDFNPGDREPSAEETLIVELINRFRADPKAEAARIAPPGAATATYSGKGVDWKMFVDEMSALKAAPPVVINLELLDAARRHSHYMILNSLGHVEDSTKPGFYAEGFGERCKKSAYAGFAGGENAFRDPPHIKGSHTGFVVDNGEGPGGMQPTRGHRMNLINPGFKEVGGSAVPHGKSFCVTHDLGSRKPRMVGGVVYSDKNSDSFYGVGEGIGGITIKSSDGASTTTWKSGGFSLDLKSEGPVTITAEFAGQSFSKTFEAGKENVKFDWIVPEKYALDRADQLISAVEKVIDTKSPTYTNALLMLYLGTRGLGLDAARTKRIETLAGTIGSDLESHQAAVLEGLKNFDPRTFGKIIDDNRRPYRNTMAMVWFQQAEIVASIKLSVKSIELQKDENPKIVYANKKQLAEQIQELEKQLTFPALKQEMAAMLVALKIPDSAAKKSKV